MNRFMTEALTLKLDKMLNGQNHFSICDLDEIARLLGVNAEAHPEYRFLHTLHCVHYSKMSPELKAQLPTIIMQVLTCRFDAGLMARAISAVYSGEVNDAPIIEDIEVQQVRRPKLFWSR